MAQAGTRTLTVDLVDIAGLDIAGIHVTVELAEPRLVYPVGQAPGTETLFPDLLTRTSDVQGLAAFELLPSSVAGAYKVTIGGYCREILMPDRDVRLSQLHERPGSSAFAIRAGWSVDAVADAAELTASSVSNMLTIPDDSGALHLAVWRSDAAGGDPSEVHVAAARGWRGLFGAAVSLEDMNGVPGEVIVTVDAQDADLLSGETLQVI